MAAGCRLPAGGRVRALGGLRLGMDAEVTAPPLYLPGHSLTPSGVCVAKNSPMPTLAQMLDAALATWPKPPRRGFYPKADRSMQRYVGCWERKHLARVGRRGTLLSGGNLISATAALSSRTFCHDGNILYRSCPPHRSVELLKCDYYD